MARTILPRKDDRSSAKIFAVLISIEEGRDRVLGAVGSLGSERVALADARARVLAEDLTSAVDVPPFDSSAMDGFALEAGPARALDVSGEARAGHPHEAELMPGTAVRISTGAAVPAGATAVIPVERTSENWARVEVEETRAGANIRRAGEDLRAGDVVLAAGTLLGPAELGVAASVGRAELVCARRPRVALPNLAARSRVERSRAASLLAVEAISRSSSTSPRRRGPRERSPPRRVVRRRSPVR